MADRRLTSLDVGILRCLQQDARMPIARIAGRLGVPESTARHRLKQLRERGVIEFTALTNPLALGYQIWALIEIQAELTEIRSIAQKLAAMPEVHYVAITTGNCDIWIAAVFDSNETLLKFITEKLSAISGIIRTATSNVLELVKRSMTIELDEDVLLHRTAGKGKTALGWKKSASGRRTA